MYENIYTNFFLSASHEVPTGGPLTCCDIATFSPFIELLLKDEKREINITALSMLCFIRTDRLISSSDDLINTVRGRASTYLL